jgi:hypothetical protein
MTVANSLEVEGNLKVRAWQWRSSRPVVPLAKLQQHILRTLDAHRNPEGYVAGSTPLHRGGHAFPATSTSFTSTRRTYCGGSGQERRDSNGG